MELHESAEDYLEAILIVEEENGACRSVDLAHQLNVSKPSVSRAVGLLRDGGYLTVDEHGFLRLTSVGLEVAQRIYERHKVISTWLMNIGVNKETALEDACKIEHDISVETFDCMKKYIGM